MTHLTSALQRKPKLNISNKSDTPNLTILDCFCGMGGASEGFHQEGFECIGIDNHYLSYPYDFIYKDMRYIKGRDFRGFDVIWGSPPCREFTTLKHAFGKFWKEPPNLNHGLDLVKTYLRFVEDANPKIWIMENVQGLTKHLETKPNMISYIGTPRKIRAFWGTFPLFLMPLETGLKSHQQISDEMPFNPKRMAIRSKIPLACSSAFAKACKQKLLETPQ